MKKKVTLAVMLVCLAISVVGCKGSKDSTGEDTVKDYSSFVTLGEYKGIEVVVEVAEVTEEEIDMEIATVLEENATTKAITDRTVEAGDVVNIDYEGLLDGVAFDGGTDTGYELTIGSNAFIPGFEDQLIGAKVGEKKSLDITFPADYTSADLAGKAVVFKVTVNSISVKTVPELTDAFVKTTFPEFATVAKYKENLKSTLEADKKTAAEDAKKDDIMEAIVANSKISEYPQEDVDAYLTSAKEYYTEMATSSGTDFATFISSQGMTEETFNETFTEYAKQAVATQMVVQAIAKKEKIKLSDKEYTAAVKQYSTDYGVTEDKLLEANGEEKVRQQAIFDKVVTFLAEKAVEVAPTAAPVETPTTAPEGSVAPAETDKPAK